MRINVHARTCRSCIYVHEAHISALSLVHLASQKDGLGLCCDVEIGSLGLHGLCRPRLKISGLAIISVGLILIWIYMVFATDSFLRFFCKALQASTFYMVLVKNRVGPGHTFTKNEYQSSSFLQSGMRLPLCHAFSVQCRMRAPKPRGKNISTAE